MGSRRSVSQQVEPRAGLDSPFLRTIAPENPDPHEL